VAAKASFEKVCDACQKTYYSENAYQNHVGSQKHRLRAAALLKNGHEATDDETASIMSSTISLGAPINAIPAQPVVEPVKEFIEPEAEEEFSKVVNNIKETKINEDEPVSRRPTRPHHSSNENRSEHPMSPPKDSSSAAPTIIETPMPSSDIPLNRCLFCNYDSPTFKLNIHHMTKHHGMFIPEQKYLVDEQGLIRWLYAKIHTEPYECLYCNKSKASPEAIQTHMKDVGHCMIAFEAEEDMIQVGQFYDFRSTYSDHSDSDIEDYTPAHTSPKILRTVVVDENGDQEMANGDENAGGWETDSSADSVATDEVTGIPLPHDQAYKRLPSHRHHSRDDPRPHLEKDGYHSHAHAHHAVFHSDHELHLPSGRTAGHRSLARYYRQNLHNHPSEGERVERQLLLEHAALNGQDDIILPDASGERGRQVATRNEGMVGVTEQKRREVEGVEKRETRKAQRAEKGYQWGVDKRGNQQKHYRDPMLQ